MKGIMIYYPSYIARCTWITSGRPSWLILEVYENWLKRKASRSVQYNSLLSYSLLSLLSNISRFGLLMGHFKSQISNLNLPESDNHWTIRNASIAASCFRLCFSFFASLNGIHLAISGVRLAYLGNTSHTFRIGWTSLLFGIHLASLGIRFA